MQFIAAFIWGALSAQLLVQVVASLIIAFVYLTGLMFSGVAKSLNAMGTLVGFAQTLLFTVLLFGGTWVATQYIDYSTWNAESIASLVAFLLTISYCGRQVPGKILLARLCAWKPYFVEAVNTQPARERVAFARKVVKN